MIVAEPILPFLKDLFLAFIQGMAEIFPVSSSGHLALFGYVLDRPVSYNQILFLHLGTFVSILLFFRRQAWDIVSGQRGWKLPVLLLGSFAATVVVGFVFRRLADRVAGQPQIVAVLLMANGVALGLMSAFYVKGERSIHDLRTADFLILGVVQGITALPGISRLGFTLGTGLFLGLSWFEALNLSFLLSLPTVLMANVYTWISQFQGGIQDSSGAIGLKIAGTPVLHAAAAGWPASLAILLIALVMGWIALQLLFKHFGRKLLAYFAVYCVASGLFFRLLIMLF